MALAPDRPQPPQDRPRERASFGAARARFTQIVISPFRLQSEPPAVASKKSAVESREGPPEARWLRAEQNHGKSSRMPWGNEDRGADRPRLDAKGLPAPVAERRRS